MWTAKGKETCFLIHGHVTNQVAELSRSRKGPVRRLAVQNDDGKLGMMDFGQHDDNCRETKDI
jgi:hypothetical protein